MKMNKTTMTTALIAVAAAALVVWASNNVGQVEDLIG